MPYYHVYIRIRDEKGREEPLFEYDDPEQYVREEIVSPILKNQMFHFCGRFIKKQEIKVFRIFESEKAIKELILPNGKNAWQEDNTVYVSNQFTQGNVDGVVVVTEKFISILGKETETTESPTEAIGKKNKVFVGHGRDMKEALELQKYLREDLKVDAQMFEDLRKVSGCKTIIELLDYFKKSVAYAFIILTPDDYGCLCERMDALTNSLCRDKKKSRTEAVNEICEALDKRARQNVVFELGLFIGAIPRDRVCYLLQKDVSDTPSNMDGVLHEPFDKSISDTFVAIAEKLKNIGLVKA